MKNTASSLSTGVEQPGFSINFLRKYKQNKKSGKNIAKADYLLEEHNLNANKNARVSLLLKSTIHSVILNVLSENKNKFNILKFVEI